MTNVSFIQEDQRMSEESNFNHHLEFKDRISEFSKDYLIAAAGASSIERRKRITLSSLGNEMNRDINKT